MLSVFCCLFVLLWTCDARSVKEAEVRDDDDDSGKTVFELDEFLNGTFSSRTWNGTWISDTEFVYRDVYWNIYKFDMETKSSELFLPRSVMIDFSGSTYTLSEDLAYVLIKYNVSSVFRHSTTAQFTIYDIANEEYFDVADGKPIQLATFAPTGHSLVYVYENNIYYVEDFSVDISNPITVTTAGVPGIVYCGVPDWVYEEEVFGSGTALWISPSATHIAYAVFHDENVEEFSYYIYAEEQYPTVATIKYPKVGTANPLVAVYVYEISTEITTEFQLPPAIDNKVTNDYVLYDLTWVSDTEVSMISTNRIQNKSIIIRCDISGACQQEESYEQENGWVSARIPRYSKDGNSKLEILPQPEDDDNFFHIVLTDLDSKTKTRLTHGKRVVTTIHGWDEDNGLVYYAGSVADTPSQQQIYVVSTTGEDKCLSCEMEVDGEYCQYATGYFSKSFSYHVTVCSGPNPIYVTIQNTQDASDVIVYQNNEAVRSSLALKYLPIIRKLTVPIKDEFTAHVQLVLPHNLDESGNTKYPAIVNVYGGPNSNQVSDSFSTGIQNYFATNRQYIYIYIDGRGSGRDGTKRMFQLYKKFATVEIEDQIFVTKYLQENLPYIDANRTGIWGWSYGGFASSWALVKDTEHVFNFALAVAPVTSFIYYDTIYTERYMGLPTAEDNEIGYNNTDLTRNAEAFRGRRYFIIHGNADDNVHYQNAMTLVRALEHDDIDFMQQSYPDEAHSLSSVSRHLYHTLDKYFARCFDIEGPPIISWNAKEHDS